jgi:hypothetical protein
MSRFLPRFVRLSIRDQLFFVIAILLAAFLRIYIKFRGFNHTVKLLSLFKTVKPSERISCNLERYTKSIELCYLFSPYINCLAICTAHWWLMKRRGISVQMKFGMKKRNEKLVAHSWLEYNGEAFSEDSSKIKKYTAFETSIL